VKARAVFLDRDGVVVEDAHYLRTPDQLRLIPGSARAIARLRDAGFKVILVTNQSAVARGLVTRKDVGRVHRALRGLLKKEGALLDAIFVCPHHPGFDRACRCRKPGTGMLEAAARRFGLDLGRCFLVGDKTSDVQTARNAGCAGVLVRTGKGGRDGTFRVRPEAVCGDLAEAADWILGLENAREIG
jgi:histidinol-phosphate phosphatase family protein